MKYRDSGLVLLLAFAVLFFVPTDSHAQEVILSANSDAAGATTYFSNTGSMGYMKFVVVDGNVNRVRIVDDKNYVFYDGHPDVNQTIYLPAGSYHATAWSGYGTSLASAIQCSFVNAPQTPQVQSVRKAGDYGFKEATSPSDYTSVKSVGAPPYYYYNYDYYNPYYPRYYPNHNPGYIPQTTSTPSSVTDRAYMNQQRSVTNSDYVKGQRSVIDKSW